MRGRRRGVPGLAGGSSVTPCLLVSLCARDGRLHVDAHELNCRAIVNRRFTSRNSRLVLLPRCRLDFAQPGTRRSRYTRLLSSPSSKPRAKSPGSKGCLVLAKAAKAPLATRGLQVTRPALPEHSHRHTVLPLPCLSTPVPPLHSKK